jgi:hypothetical protein
MVAEDALYGVNIAASLTLQEVRLSWRDVRPTVTVLNQLIHSVNQTLYRDFRVYVGMVGVVGRDVIVVETTDFRGM